MIDQIHPKSAFKGNTKNVDIALFLKGLAKQCGKWKHAARCVVTDLKKIILFKGVESINRCITVVFIV